MKRFSTLFFAMLLAGTASAQISVEGNPCVGEELSFSIKNVAGHYDKFDWNFADGTNETTTDKSATVKHTYSDASTYKVTLNASSNADSDTSYTYTLTINNLPEADFTIDTTPQESIRLFTVSTDESSLSYEWEFGDGSTFESSENTASHTYSASGTYTVLLTYAAKGCSDTVSHSLKIAPSTKVPNAFTPNGDGQNDCFMISADGATLKLEIFNRWGYKVFSRTGSENIVWDGYNPQGTLVSPGTYFYTITVEEGSTSYNPLNGYITVFY